MPLDSLRMKSLTTSQLGRPRPAAGRCCTGRAVPSLGRSFPLISCLWQDRPGFGPALGRETKRQAIEAAEGWVKESWSCPGNGSRWAGYRRQSRWLLTAARRGPAPGDCVGLLVPTRRYPGATRLISPGLAANQATAPASAPGTPRPLPRGTGHACKCSGHHQVADWSLRARVPAGAAASTLGDPA